MDKFYGALLEGEECLCGKEKQKGQAFCHDCFSSLPDDMKREIYRQLHKKESLGFIIGEATSFLKEKL